MNLHLENIKLEDSKKATLQWLFLKFYSVVNYTTPCASIASATFTNPAMFAPLT